LHFIGTLDFTNFVYSFALVFGIIGGLLQFVFLAVDRLLRQPPDVAWIKLRKPFLAVTNVSAIIILASFVEYVPKLLGIDSLWLLAVAYSLLAGSSLMALYLWVKLDTVTLFDIGTSLLIVTFCVFNWGKAVAHDQEFSSNLYKIVTHDSVIDGAALVRSSSAGFIVALGGKIMFLPTSEIRQIVAHDKLKP
jgi:hypothetical protein